MFKGLYKWSKGVYRAQLGGEKGFKRVKRGLNGSNRCNKGSTGVKRGLKGSKGV